MTERRTRARYRRRSSAATPWGIIGWVILASMALFGMVACVACGALGLAVSQGGG